MSLVLADTSVWLHISASPTRSCRNFCLETLELIEREQLHESGCGAVDLLFMPPSAFSRPCFARGSAGCERARYKRACRTFGQGQQAANRMHTVDSDHIEGPKRKRVSRR
jgi:hypothetical protein